MKKALVTGGSGGIGRGVCSELARRNVEFESPDRTQLDLSNPLNIDQLDLSDVDTVFYCAGTNQGTYRGFEHNSMPNQLAQINVNFVSPLMLAKKFVQSPKASRFLWIGSAGTHEHKAFKICYSSGKMALKYAIDTLRPEYPGIVWSEVQIGRARTNLRWKNYEGTKTQQEVELEYDSMDCLTVPQVVDMVFRAIDNKIEYLELLP